MSIEQIHKKNAVAVKAKKQTTEKWTRQKMPKLNSSNVSEHLLAMTQSEQKQDVFLMQLLQHVVSVTHAMGALCFFLGEKQQLIVGPQLLSKELMSAVPDIVGKISEQATDVVKTGVATTVVMDQFVNTVVPVKQASTITNVLVAVYPSKHNHDNQLLNNQLFSSYIHLWRSYQNNTQLNVESYFSSALLELVTLLQQAETKPDFDSLLVNQLQPVLNCHQVAFGRYMDNGKKFELSTISGVSDIDKRSHLKSLLELCSFESQQYDQTISLSRLDVDAQSSQSEQTLFVSHQRLLKKVEAEYLVSTTLVNGDNVPVGALLIWWSKTPNDIQLKKQFLEAANEPLSTSITVSGEKRAHLFKTNKQSIWFRYKFIFLALFLTALMVLTFLPVDHKVVAKVSLEPVFQRIVATRYDGVLKEILVEPGEQVSQGQVLALLDDQDLLLKQQSLQAEYDSAIKDRNLKVAASKISESQIANLDVQRLSLDMELLNTQLKDLSIIAPIEGLVISENIDRRQGSLLKKGEILFELAPLQKMFAELAIPAEDISYIEEGAPIVIQLDALPKEQWQVDLQNIQPRSIVVDSENVFIAKVPLENNTTLALKPGMQGQANITLDKRSLGWVLLHKAANRISRWFSMTFTSPK